MKIWVWQGNNVLRDYGTGLAVVSAASVDEAWEKLRAEQPSAWFHLTYGRSTMCDDLEFAMSMLDEDEKREAIEQGFPVQPVGYDPADLPALVCWGSS